MRVTHNMMSKAVVLQLQRQTEQLFNVQTQIATQKRLNKPSDDPAGMRRVLAYQSQLALVEQYQHNIQQGETLIETNELTLGLIDELIGLAREIALNYGTPDASPPEKQLAADEINGLYDQIVELVNSKSGSDYIFAGYQTDTPPFGHVIDISGGIPADIVFGLCADATNVTIEIRDSADTVVRTITLGDGFTLGSGGIDGINAVSWDGNDDGGAPLPDGQYTFTITANNDGNPVPDYVTYNGDDGQLPIIIGENVEVYLDRDGRNYFAPPGGLDVFELLQDLVAGLQNPNPDDGHAQIITTVEKLDQARLQLNYKRSEYGPKLSRLEQAENYWSTLSANIELSIDKIQEADVTRASVELQQLMLAYETTIAAAAQMIKPGILNFLE